MWNPSAALVTSITLAWTLSACAGDDPGARSGTGEGVTVRDSAGVTIVENHDSAWTAETHWTVAAEPDLVIGSLDGSVPGTDWGQMVKPLLVGDRVLVSDAISAELRMFDREGRFLRTVGSRGQGPNEVASAGLVAVVPGDSAVIWDLVGRKIVRLGLESGGGASHATGEPPTEMGEWTARFSRWFVTDWFEDGSYLVSGIPNLGTLDPGLHRIEQEWHRMSPTGEHLGRVGMLPQQLLWVSGGDQNHPIPFGPLGIHDARGLSLWFAFPVDSFEYSRYDEGVGPTQIVRVDAELAPISEEMVARYYERQDSGMSGLTEQGFPADMLADFRRNQQRARDEMPRQKFMSPFVRLIVDPARHLWAELSIPELRDWGILPEVNGLPEHIALRWAVFDTDGRWLGTVTTPPGLYVTDISEEYILGVRRDDLDVPFIERYRILKPG